MGCEGAHDTGSDIFEQIAVVKHIISTRRCIRGLAGMGALVSDCDEIVQQGGKHLRGEGHWRERRCRWQMNILGKRLNGPLDTEAFQEFPDNIRAWISACFREGFPHEIVGRAGIHG